ncbi:flagellar protein [Pseudoroseomonas deserti]|uniref:Flagellar protein n=1 Tax=Teichococcus deserti TaxID=1817963 RepID=A0A1V2H644_9PROT|nr:DUF1217 domain-containing protein [Pseudoroseomonas deserti]ONG55262.1 flagellar protein [Pseudoroseomonas deserti]
MSVSAVAIGVPTGLAGWKLLQSKTPADFKAFTKDPVLQRDIAYLREKLPTKLTAQELLADRRLQAMVLQAYGLDKQIGFDALMRKVLDSNPDDDSSTAARMVDYRYRQIAADLNYGGISIPEIPAVLSSTTLQMEGVMTGQTFTSFNGTMGGVKVEGVNLEGMTKRSDIAAALQAAFQKADGGRGDITVQALGVKIIFSDAKGRGKSDFTFIADPDSTPRAYLLSESAGSQRVAGSGGPKVTDSATIDAIVAKFTQARFEESLGQSSDSLRRAVYAKRLLPQIANWYSVIADRNLATVVQAALGLPDSFGQIDVDRQKTILEQRMDIADFKDLAKLGKIIERYVAQSSIEEAKAFASGGLSSLVQPVYWGRDSFDGSAAAALLSTVMTR